MSTLEAKEFISFDLLRRHLRFLYGLLAQYPRRKMGTDRRTTSPKKKSYNVLLDEDDCTLFWGWRSIQDLPSFLAKKYSRVDKETADTDISEVSCINQIGSNKNVRLKEKGREWHMTFFLKIKWRYRSGQDYFCTGATVASATQIGLIHIC